VTLFNKSKIKELIRDNIKNAFKIRNGSVDLFSNTLDIFSAVIDSRLLKVDLENWKKFEEHRQTQKSIQNIVGEIHQKVIGTFNNWQDLGTGEIIDVINIEKRIIAEIKNKHNTTKGNHKINIYDDLKWSIEKKYNGYTGYYVEILPKNKKIYDHNFRPSDNKKKNKRPDNPKIRIIDGKSFYKIVTGDENGICELFKLLPKIIDEILLEENLVKKGEISNLDYRLMNEFYQKTYSN
tara:strand:- start:224 stop:934 length:711 start_codon:yes stop_codon:yes gene_type:complete